ncbi:MAG: hypothetical protein QOI00_1873 [Chloroflexota bacterium]|nr:hypothetical protein [Chloroflexota bacterium]
MTAAPGGPIDVLLADGGHVIIDFEDPVALECAAGDAILTALIQADGSEHDLERAIVEEARVGGLSASVSTSRHPTTVVIEMGEPLPDPRTGSSG